VGRDRADELVDDDQSLVESTVTLMESVGFNAEGFFSAEDFLSSPRLRCTACLILDVRMPSMGGFELQRRLARAGYYHGSIDGVLGPQTRRAIRAYEQEHENT